MLEKVNKFHPDRVGRPYCRSDCWSPPMTRRNHQKLQVEVLLGHGHAMVVIKVECYIQPRARWRCCEEHFRNRQSCTYSGTTGSTHSLVTRARDINVGETMAYSVQNGILSMKKLQQLSKELARGFPIRQKNTSLTLKKAKLQSVSQMRRW